MDRQAAPGDPAQCRRLRRKSRRATAMPAGGHRLMCPLLDCHRCRVRVQRTAPQDRVNEASLAGSDVPNGLDTTPPSRTRRPPSWRASQIPGPRGAFSSASAFRYTAPGAPGLSSRPSSRTERRTSRRALATAQAGEGRVVLKSAASCFAQTNGTWKVPSKDTGGDDLTAVVALENGALVVTLF